ncbi:MAG: hypothetical protein EBR30_15500 [Cytophagia bacterium]|nr:hypothetical protein [Cytophagia bacterium]NBW36391.1 hypothetical protein [Cytophagia bacterium]
MNLPIIMKKKITLVAIFLIVTLIFFACENQESPILDINSNEIQMYDILPEDSLKYLNYLETIGFERNMIRYNDGIFIIEDILISQNDLDERIIMESKKSSAHYRYQYPVSDDYINTVYVYLDASVSSEWTNAAIFAINKWNESSLDTKIYFRQVLNQNEATTVITANWASFLPRTFIGYAIFPTYDGKPGNKIYINTDYNYLPTANKRLAMVHEMGHTIGFQHTNVIGGDVFIPGTPSVDNLSVMNSIIFNNWNQQFTSGDVTAIETFYPCTQSKIINFPNGGPAFQSWIYKPGFSILWKNGCIPSTSVKLDVITSSGQTFPIIASTPNDGEYYYTPYFRDIGCGSEIKIKISSVTDPSVTDQSDNFSRFCSLITDPQGSIYSFDRIQWSNSEIQVSTVNFEIRNQSNVLIWSQNSIPNNGYYQFTSGGPSLTVGQDYVLKLTSNENSGIIATTSFRYEQD